MRTGKGYNGVHRVMLSRSSNVYVLNALAVSKNVEGERYHDAEVPIESGVLFEVEDLVSGKLKHFDFSSEAESYISEIEAKREKLKESKNKNLI